MKELIEIIRARQAQPAIPFALATVVYVDGSSYRKPGARMLIGLNGRVAGSVSGGCLERDVITKARAILLGAPMELAVYDTTDQDDMAFGTSLGCEGRIEILIQLLEPGADWPLADAVDRALRQRRPLPLATPYRAAAAADVPLGTSLQVEAWPAEWQPELASVADEVMITKKPASTHLVSPGIDLLVERLAPLTRLVIFGAGHDVPPLVRLAKEVGYHVTVVDRRADFADPERFPGADAVRHLRPRDVADASLLDADAAAVVMNHHYETDAELLTLLVARPLAYLGMLGPRKRTLKILREARSVGVRFSSADLARLHAPVGLDLGSETPEQIALCILAEVQAVVNGRTAVHLRKGSPLAAELFGEPAALEPA
jgi:xanthine/CO dehydrogenase XdhC/CoxF family maturation factor